MPDTSAYYHAAYIAAGTLYVLYTVTLWVRARRVRERLAAAERNATATRPLP